MPHRDAKVKHSDIQASKADKFQNEIGQSLTGDQLNPAPRLVREHQRKHLADYEPENTLEQFWD